MKWLKEHKQLAYSKEKSGSFCKCCSISRSKFVGKDAHRIVETLITNVLVI